MPEDFDLYPIRCENRTSMGVPDWYAEIVPAGLGEPVLYATGWFATREGAEQDAEDWMRTEHARRQRAAGPRT